ncbi:MAG: hypothetical protein AAF620_06560 [Bacteroidota bacterium]
MSPYDKEKSRLKSEIDLFSPYIAKYGHKFGPMTLINHPSVSIVSLIPELPAILNREINETKSFDQITRKSIITSISQFIEEILNYDYVDSDIDKAITLIKPSLKALQKACSLILKPKENDNPENILSDKGKQVIKAISSSYGSITRPRDLAILIVAMKKAGLLAQRYSYLDRYTSEFHKSILSLLGASNVGRTSTLRGVRNILNDFNHKDNDRVSHILKEILKI